MKAFNIAQYEQPEFESIDWQKTKYNVGVFLTAYKKARERVGQPACPRRTMEYSLLNKEVIQNEGLNDYEEFRHEFIRLNKLFVLGYTSIMHAHYPEITEREVSALYKESQREITLFDFPPWEEIESLFRAT